ncbi:MAG: lysophospholipid acyltransferase family protein [Fibromonadales bacterium]|nr:lysophospholipid acyltransferase family protein [Fibromonadales bacterium]
MWKKSVFSKNLSLTKPFFERMGVEQPQYGVVLKNMFNDILDFVFCNPAKRKIDVPTKSMPVLNAMKHGGIFLTAHYGNHELLGYKLAEFGLPLIAAAQEQKPAIFNKWLQKKRSFKGKCYAKKVDSQRLLEFIDDGGLFAILADQRGRSDCIGEFLGVETHCNPLPAFILEHRPNTPIFCGCLRDDTLLVEKISADDFYAYYHSWLEHLILKRPEKWYGWFHNRFQSSL